MGDALIFDEAGAIAKLTKLAETSQIARDAIEIVRRRDERIAALNRDRDSDAADAAADLEDQRKLVVAIEEIVQARIAWAYSTGEARILEAMEEVARDIAKAKADFT